MSTKVVTGKVRFSYVSVFKSRSFGDGQDAKYSVSLLIPKSDKATLKKVRAAIEEPIQEGIASKWGGKKPANLRTPLRDGDTDHPDDPAYAGHYFINANSSLKPGVIDRDKNEILDPEEVYSGCYGRASVNFYPYNFNGNKGVGAGLNNLQKLSEGERLGGRASAEDDFADDFEDDEDDF